MKRFGLVGKNIAYSFSPKYFQEKFKREKIENASYELFDLNEIEEIEEIFSIENLTGLNVTIPYKNQIIPFLNELSAEAAEIQAVNVVEFKNEKKIGHNTDIIGFEKSLLPLLDKNHKSALILGSGGASKAVVFVLKKLEIPFKIVSRNNEKGQFNYSELTDEIINHNKLIINTTPLGNLNYLCEFPNIKYDAISSHHLCFDLTYNPEESLFLKKSKMQGAKIKNGLEMLEIQAEEAWKIWND